MDNNKINSIIDNSIKIADDLGKKYNYPSNITHLFYLIIPAFIIKYGLENERLILDSFMKIPVLINDKQDQVHQAYYTSRPVYINDQIITHKGIVLNNYQNISLLQLIDNLVHEFNHAINSINQELTIIDDKLYIRTGLTAIIYNKNNLTVIGKQDNSILEEIINTKQSEMIIDIINSLSNYEINNSTVVSTLYSIKNSIENSYQSNAYLLQSLVCKNLIENKTFFSTIENLRFKGNVNDIESWFDTITGKDGSYNRLIELLRQTIDYQVELSKKKKFKYFIINKIKKLNQEAMSIVKLFDQNCNYR